jgi:hypothetical protein
MKPALHSHWKDSRKNKNRFFLKSVTSGSFTFYDMNGIALVTRNYTTIKDRKKQIKSWKKWYNENRIDCYYHIVPDVSEHKMSLIILPD